MSLNSSISLEDFCLDNLPVGESRVLNYSTTRVRGSICHLNCNGCFCLLACFFCCCFCFYFWCSFAWYIDVKNYNVSFLIFPFDEYAVSFPVFFLITFGLKSILPDIKLAVTLCFLGSFLWNIFSIFLSFSLR